jgi:hypothetical protein
MVGCVKDGVSLFKICFTTKELVFIRGERYSRTADVCLILDANIGISASKNEVYCLSMTQGTKVQYFATVIPGALKDISAHQCMEEIFRIDLGETVRKIRTLSVSKTLISTESGSLWCLTRVDENTRAQLLIKTQSRILDAVEETYKKSLQMNGFLHRIRGGTHNCIIDAEFICLSSDLIESSHIMRNLFL